LLKKVFNKTEKDKMTGLFYGAVILLSALSCVHSVTSNPNAAFLPKPKFNPTAKLLLTKLAEVRLKAEGYLEKNGIVKKPSPDYP
jgi:hypothetical protein